MQYKNNMPFAVSGIPVPQVSFSGGRVTADIASHGGFTHIRYFGEQPTNRSEFFTADPISAWLQLFRLFIKIDDSLYYAEFNDTTFYPFGYESFCELDGVRFRHDLILLNDELTVEIQVLSGAENRSISYGWHITECAVRKEMSTREWSPFTIDDNILFAEVKDHNPETKPNIDALTQKNGFGYVEPENASTFIGVGSDNPLSIRQTGDSFKKSYIYADNVRKALFVLSFSTSSAALREFDAANTKSERKKVLERFKMRMATLPEFDFGDDCLNAFVANAGPLADSLQVADIPGGYRAADSGYWIWGWDSMVHCDSQLWAGDSDGVRDMLRFYRDTAHSELGIFHSLSASGKPMLAMAPAAQTLYAVTMYRHYCFTHDLDALKEFYPFAKQVVERALKDEVGDTGLYAGVALYPDFPEDLEQNGNDISSFNNSIVYQALRSMSVCSEILGLNEESKQYALKAEKLRDAFNTFLFDEEVGYYYDSISSIDFAPRKHYPIYAVLATSPFAIELADENILRIADFMKHNLTDVKYGLTLVPRNDPNFMIDGNQIGMYMPVAEGFYRKVMRKAGYHEEALGFIDLIKWSWSKISVLESLACEAVNNGLTLDNPGRKQWFCYKAWHTLLFEIGLGMTLDHEKLILSKPLLPDATLSNLNIPDTISGILTERK